MFHLHTFDGIQFNVPVESLKRRGTVEKVSTAYRTRKTIDREAGNGAPKQEENQSSYALEAYRKSVKMENRREPIFHAYSIMKSPVISIDPELNIIEAWNLFKAKKVNHMPVLSSGNKITGMVSSGDLLKHLIIEGDKILGASDMTIKDIMTGDVITADRITDIRRIAKVMFDNHIGTMPIVDEEGTLLGIITRSDILYALINYPPLNLWG